MQGSFWKTVALVGVIGVGCLALLEVQNRLKNSPSALEGETTENDDSLLKQLNSVDERQVNAELSDSEFDQMMKQGFSEGGATAAADQSGGETFNLSEPAETVSTDQTFDTDGQFSMADFELSDPAPAKAPAEETEVTKVAAADTSAHTAFASFDQVKQESPDSAIDTTINADALSEAGNPFAAFDDPSAAAATGQTPVTVPIGKEDSAIQPTAFATDEPTASSAEPPAFDSAEETPFALFDLENADPSTPSTTSQPGTDVAEGSSGTSNQPSSQPIYYNGRERATGEAALQKSVQASPTGFEQDRSNSNGSFGEQPEFQPFPAENSGPASDLGQPGALSDFGLDENPVDQPGRLPETESTGSPFFGGESLDPPGNERPVPMPREHGFGEGIRDSTTPDPGSPSEGGFPIERFEPDGRDIPADRSSQPEPGGTFDDAGDSGTSPFREDLEDRTPLAPVPGRGNEGRLAIPGADPDFDNLPDSRRPTDTFGSERTQEPISPSDPGREFTPPQRRDPRMPFGDSDTTQPDFGGTEFDRTVPDVRTPRDPGFGSEPDFGGREPVDFQPRETMPSRPAPFDRERERSRTLDSERQWESESINPGFGSPSPGLPADERLEPIRENAPLTIDPGFGDRRFESGRTRESDDRRFPEDRFGTERTSPSRDFGSSEPSRPLRERSDREINPYDRSEDMGTGPMGRREFGAPSTYDRYESTRGDSNIRQVASVMRPKLVLQKKAPENATVGQMLDYSIMIRNDGDAPAYDVIVEDETTQAARVEAAEPLAERSADGRYLLWQFDRIDPGTEKEIRVKVTPTGEGVIDGVATVKFKSRVKSTTMITAPRLTLDMEGPTKVRLGDKVQYLYTIVNEGKGQAQSVFVRTVLPQDGGLRHPQGQDLEYEIPVLEPGERREILLSVVAGREGQQRAEATVSSRNGSKASASWPTDVIGAQLQMLRRGPKRRFVGTPARYENLVTNETDFDCENARVVEAIPPGMNFKAAGQGGVYDPVSRTVTWEIRRLRAGATETLKLELIPAKEGKHTSKVTILENIGAQNEPNVSTTIVEDLHNVSATISQVNGPIPIGEVVGFTIKIQNRGTAQATDVELVVDVPEEFQIESAGSETEEAYRLKGTNQIVFPKAVRIDSRGSAEFEMRLKAIAPGRNLLVKARVKYPQMTKDLDLAESVTIYDDQY